MYNERVQQQRVEARVLDIVDRVVRGDRVEDDRVELKRRWPTDVRRAARQIAGLANSAAGEPIIWIVGLDENDGVKEPGDVEPATWWSQVSSWFSEVPPDLTLLRVPTPHGAVAALYMETGRTPYVVTTNGAGGVDREVPYRRGTTLRSAHRSEILRAVVGEVQVPRLDAISAWVRIVRAAEIQPDEERRWLKARPRGLDIEFQISAYVEALQPVRLPQHRWSMTLSAARQRWGVTLSEVSGPRIGTGGTPSGGIRYEQIGSIAYVQNSGLHVNGSDSIRLTGRHFLPDEGELDKLLGRTRRLEFEGQFPIALSARHASLLVVLQRSAKTPMEENILRETHRLIDDRVGEFSHGGGRPYEYQGRLAQTLPGPEG